jgi:signal transduction histidine kinase
MAKSDFLATMSHELRTPLNAIAGYAELLEMGIHGPLNDPQREAIVRIQRSQRHLLGLINDILNFARIEAGQLALNLEDVAVRELIRELEPLIAPQLGAKALAVEVEDSGAGLSARADPEKTRQILLNLLSNAIKFTPRGGRITIRGEERDSRVCIRIADTGSGIPSDQLEQIFEPFVQLNRTLASAHEGAGLGLAISRDLARAMGGDVTAESVVGEGSTFTLTLPKAGDRSTMPAD